MHCSLNFGRTVNRSSPASQACAEASASDRSPLTESPDWSMPHNDNDKRQNSTIDASLNLPKHNNKKITSAVIRTLCQISVLPHHIVSPYHQQLSVYSYYCIGSFHHITLELVLLGPYVSNYNICLLNRPY